MRSASSEKTAAEARKSTPGAECPLLLDALGRRVLLVALGGLEFGPVAAVVVGAPEGRRYPHPGVPGAGRLLVVASLLEYHREALRRRRILHVPLPKLGQRPALVHRRHGGRETRMTPGRPPGTTRGRREKKAFNQQKWR